MTSFGYFRIGDWSDARSVVERLGQAGAEIVYVDERGETGERVSDNLESLLSNVSAGDQLILEKVSDAVTNPLDIIGFIVRILKLECSIQFLDSEWATVENSFGSNLATFVVGLHETISSHRSAYVQGEQDRLTAKGRRPKLNKVEQDEVLRVSHFHGNEAAARRCGVSISTVERIRKNAGVTRSNFRRQVFDMTRANGTLETAKYLEIPTEIVEDIWEQYPLSWAYITDQLES